MTNLNIDAIERDFETQKQFHEMSADQLEAAFSATVEKAKSKASRAIGKSYKVKTGTKSYVTGVCTACVYKRLRRRERSVVAVFTVTLECGSVKVPREFDLERI